MSQTRNSAPINEGSTINVDAFLNEAAWNPVNLLNKKQKKKLFFKKRINHFPPSNQDEKKDNNNNNNPPSSSAKIDTIYPKISPGRTNINRNASAHSETDSTVSKPQPK